jgi:acetyl-CoA hydrolase
MPGGARPRNWNQFCERHFAVIESGEDCASLYEDLNFFRPRIVLRPQEITTSPEIARRLGVISINTALEVDFFWEWEQFPCAGRNLMNGIGSSGDFGVRISRYSFCPSTVRDGRISTIVPHCSHIDHSEHSMQAVVTEQGRRSSDARIGRAGPGRSSTCAHPDYQEDLTGYFESATGGYTPQTFRLAFAMHQEFLETGDMRGVDWGIMSRISTLVVG